MKKLILVILAMVIVGSASAQIVRKDSVQSHTPQMVIVKGDTISMELPQKNYGRYDRGLYNYLFIPQRSWDFGITASYGEFNTDDVQVLSMLKNVDFNGKLYSIKPSIAYYVANNQSVGVRVNYTKGEADLANLALDIDEDMSFTLRDVSYYSQSYDISLFYRNYVGLGPQKRFAVFNEISLDVGSGSARFKRYFDEKMRDTRTYTTSAALNFSPGVCVFMQDFVAFNVSFGVFGLHLTKERQTTNGEDEGTRMSSGANFKFNIFNINFGLMIVI